MPRTKKSTSLKTITGTIRPSRESVMKALPSVTNYGPFTPVDINLNEDQMRYFREICAILSSVGVMRASFVPEITNGAILWDILVQSKVELDADGVTQTIVSGNTSRTDVSGAFKAYAAASKQWSSWAGSMGMNLKSYGALGIIEAPTDPKQRELDELMG